MRVTRRRTALLIGFAALALAIALAYRPEPLLVQVTPAKQGTIVVTIDDDAITRVLERYEIASPIAGRQERVEVHPGDRLRTGDLLVRIHPAPLDSRQSAELSARLRAAQQIADEAAAAAQRARVQLAQASRERKRIEALATTGISSAQSAEQAGTAESDARRALDAAEHRVRASIFDVETIGAAMSAAGTEGPLVLRAPVAGAVLRVHHESEGVIAAGTRILDVGDPSTLEIVADLLSTDAVKIRPGQEMIITSWGGDKPLRARVTRIEPSAFTKVSALGIEEQRVNVIARLDDPPPALGDGFRVETSTVLWRGDALQVPNTTLFRDRDSWAVFVEDGGRARLRRVEIGHRSSTATEIRSGLEAGDQVIAHPSDELEDGVRIRTGAS